MSTTHAEDDRDTITVSRGESTDRFVAKDETTGVVSQGETKAKALVNLADALELSDRPDPEIDPDDRTAVEDRAPEEIMSELERFLDERDTSDDPVFDPSGAGDDVYAREHVENLKQLTTDRE